MPIPIKIRWENGLIDLDQLADGFAQLVAQSLGVPAETLADVMRRLAPVDSGDLRASIGSVVGFVPSKNLGYAVVGPRRRSRGTPTKYAHLVEFGHVAVAPRKGAKRRKGSARDITFVPPKPFVRPAVESYAAAADGDLAAQLDRNLDLKVTAMRNGRRVKVMV